MKSFAGKRAVVTGGGSGMGRELVVQLASEGCSVATCDVSPTGLAETRARAEAVAPSGTRVTTHLCDVSDEGSVVRFRDEVRQEHGDVIELLFNNAGIAGGGSFVAGDRAEWERTFAVDWWGVYYCTRAFLPMLMAADEALLVNTSSDNGFWASVGPGVPHTAYCTAKFAVKGFSESLIEDFRVNAPNVRVAVVMPGHVGTGLLANSRHLLYHSEPDAPASALEAARAQMAQFGISEDQMAPEQFEAMMKEVEDQFCTRAPLDAAGAVREILEAIRAGKWRILVGDDARRLDEMVRADPEHAYDHDRFGFTPFASMQEAAAPPPT